MGGIAGTRTVPIVDYLVLGEEPHLIAHRCLGCGAEFFDHRIGCAACGGREFVTVTVPRVGVLRAFTIVHVAPPGVAVPYVAGIVDCAGTQVRANVVNVAPAAEAVRVGMPVQLCVFSLGTDHDGVEAIGFGFEPGRCVDGVR